MLFRSETISTDSIPVITGRAIARWGKTKSILAATVAMIVKGERRLEGLTLRQLCRAFGVSSTSVGKALALSPVDRQAMAESWLTLAEIAAKLRSGAHQTVHVDLTNGDAGTPAATPRMTLDDFKRNFPLWSRSEQVACGRYIGVERVWQPRRRLRAV
jgi:hypothetical protein